MDFRPSDEQQMLRRSVREFAEAEMRPHVMEWDEAQHFPMELLPKLAAIGLTGIQFDEKYGGSAMPAVDYCICIEELARVDPAIALSVAAHNGLCTSHLNMFGSAEQKDRYLPRLVRGEVLGAWGLTESGAGSDAASMRTTAVRQGDCWTINGSKAFMTHGAIGGVMVVMAVTDRTKGNRGISAFVVEHGTAGMRAGKKENKLGMRASDTSEVIFEDCRIPGDRIIGDPGTGFKTALATLDHTRPTIGAQAVGIAQGALDAAIAYVKERKQFGKKIADFQAVQFMLADMAMKLEAARLMVYTAAARAERGEPNLGFISSASKCFASDVAMEVTTDAVQLFGGYGYTTDFPVERFMRDAKITQIYEGTNQIQRVVMSRALLK